MGINDVNVRNVYTLIKKGENKEVFQNFRELRDYMIKEGIEMRSYNTEKEKIEKNPIKSVFKYYNDKGELYKVQQMKRSKR